MNEADVIAFMEEPSRKRLQMRFFMLFHLRCDVRRLEGSAKREAAKYSFYRRQYIRAAAALIEGFTAMLKQNALERPESFSPEELLLLKEQEPILKENGKVSLRRQFINIRQNIRFAFETYAKTNGSHFALDVGGSRWVDLQTLFTVRDRITHPKNFDDLAITLGEVKAAHSAVTFISENHAAVLDVMLEKKLKDAGLSEDQIKKFKMYSREIEPDMTEADRRSIFQKYFG